MRQDLDLNRSIYLKKKKKKKKILIHFIVGLTTKQETKLTSSNLVN